MREIGKREREREKERESEELELHSGQPCDLSFFVHVLSPLNYYSDFFTFFFFFAVCVSCGVHTNKQKDGHGALSGVRAKVAHFVVVAIFSFFIAWSAADERGYTEDG